MIRSMLFIPGDNPKLIEKGLHSVADALIFDLEDAVSPDNKAAAREVVRDALINPKDYSKDGSPEIRRIVRINSIDTEYWKDDLREVLKGCPDMIMLPKVSAPEDVHTLIEAISEIEPTAQNEVEIIPLIETALGIENAYIIASCSDKVTGMLLGAEDLTKELRCKRTKEGREILYARSRLVACGRAAGIEIYDTPFTDTKDEAGIAMDAETAKALGFTGKSAITPRHLDAINQAFSPSIDDIEYALSVVKAIEDAESEGRGVVSLNGKMIDAPVVERAHQIIEAAREFGQL